jgi:hypothetical protein
MSDEDDADCAFSMSKDLTATAHPRFIADKIKNQVCKSAILTRSVITDAVGGSADLILQRYKIDCL